MKRIALPLGTSFTSQIKEEILSFRNIPENATKRMAVVIPTSDIGKYVRSYLSIELGDKGLGFVDVFTFKKLISEVRGIIDIKKRPIPFFKACLTLVDILKKNYDKRDGWFPIFLSHEAHFTVALYQDLQDRSMQKLDLQEPELNIWKKFLEKIGVEHFETTSGSILEIIKALQGSGINLPWQKMIIDGEISFSPLERDLIQSLAGSADISLITWKEGIDENLLSQQFEEMDIFEPENGPINAPEIELWAYDSKAFGG